MKKINSKLIKLLSVTFFISSSLFLNLSAFAKTNDHSNDPYPPRIPKVWHVVWVSSKSGSLTALWTREQDVRWPLSTNNYYGVWSNKLRANLVINAGMPRFSGNARMNNGDYCEINGMIYDSGPYEKIFDGHFNCAKGDKGTITGTIANQ